MKTIELKCTECEKIFNKNIYQYNKDVKRGKSIFLCSKNCLSLNFKKQRGINNLKKFELEIPKCKCCSIPLTYEQFKCKNKFCSHSCSAITNNKRTSILNLNIPIENVNGMCEHIDTISNKLIISWKERLLNVSFDDLGYETKRKRIITEQKNKCNVCGIDKWMNNIISLEIDHIDGNNKNNNRENLVAICPNCHSLTKTWRGRNARQEGVRVSLTDMVNAYKECGNIRQALLKLNLAAKGSNYKRMKSAILMYN